MIDLSLTAGRLSIRLSWGRPPARESAPVNAGYPMRVSTPTGFRTSPRNPFQEKP